MPFVCFSRLKLGCLSGFQGSLRGQQGLKLWADLFLDRRLELENSHFNFSAYFSTLSELHLFSSSDTLNYRTLSWAIYKWRLLSTLATISPSFISPMSTVSCPISKNHFNCLVSDFSHLSFDNISHGNLMLTSYSISTKLRLNSSNLQNWQCKKVRSPNFATRGVVSYNYRRSDGFRNASRCMQSQEPQRNRYIVCRYFSFDACGINHKPNPLICPDMDDFQSSCSTPYSSEAVSDVSLNLPSNEKETENPSLTSSEADLAVRGLKMMSGSCYLPHPDKEETGGEDAHFICVNECAIGVADGVGGWAELGVDAGEYARELMSNSVVAIQEEPKGSVDPTRVLEKAYLCTKAQGSSTACIIALTNQGIHATNLGDSGFMVIRDGSTIFQSPPQQHDFNFPYQLESGNSSDLPSTAQVFAVPVASGDVIVAGTDGLFDNLFSTEVSTIVVQAIRSGFGPEVAAQKIAAVARHRAQDRNRQTPFSTAAQEAGYRYYGGKLDDITVVVSYITVSTNSKL